MTDIPDDEVLNQVEISISISDLAESLKTAKGFFCVVVREDGGIETSIVYNGLSESEAMGLNYYMLDVVPDLSTKEMRRALGVNDDDPGTDSDL